MSLSKKVVLTVSGYKISLSDSLQFYQNDQLKLIFEINKYGIDVANSFTHKTLMPLQPLTATLFIETPLGVDSIESANIEDNAVTFYLTSNQTQHIGTSTMQIKLTDDDGCQITLPSFTFEVQKNIYDNAVHVSGILLADENNNVLSDENGNTINATATTESSKQIKDFSLKTGVSGQEDILVQDNGVTKRIKSSELIDTVDLTGYATETYVQNKIAEASLSGGEVDLSGYATKDELNKKADKTELHSHNNKTVLDGITSSKVTEWNNKSTFDGNYNSLTNKPTIPTVDVNKNYVDTQLAKKANTSDIPSLNGYATETYVQNKIAEASLSGGEVDLSGYATKDELNTKADKSTIPTKVSQLTNDKGYLTSHQDISGKADKAYVDTELAKKANTSHTHSYDDLTNKPTIPSTTNLATKTELKNGLGTKADKVHTHDQYLTEHQDISMKADKSAIPTKVSQLSNDKGYLTSHQDISGKADKSYVDTELAKKSNASHTHSYNDLTDKPTIPSTTNLATKTELTNGLATKADKVHTHDQYLTEHQDISMKADKTELHSHSNKTVLDGITSSKVTEWNNKSTFDGNYNSLTNKPTIPTVPTNVSSFTNDAGYLSSSIIKSIVVVDALPEVEVEGVLYLVRGGTSTDTPTTPEEPTVTNLYPNQTRATTSDGFTITFTGRNVTIDGRNDTKSIQCQTNQFDMALEANKTYYLKFTNVSGLFDDSKRVSQSDGMICMVALTVYDSSGTSKNLINWDERDAHGIYEKFTFTPSVACIKGKLIIQAKKLNSFSNWTCSIVIAEEGV